MSSFLLRCRRILFGSIGGLLLCAPLLAIPPNLNTDQLYHSQWTTRDGAPTGLLSIEQSTDGYLWMSSDSGLFRFDGVRFEHVEGIGGQRLLSNSIRALFAPPGGGLWIGYTFGGATFMTEGRLTHYSQREGLPQTSVMNLAQDATGTLWAGTPRGIFRLSRGKWSAAGPEWNLPQGFVNGLLVDGRGTTWAIVGRAVLFLPPGSHRFEDSGVAVAPAATDLIGLVPSPDGVAWLVRRQRGKTLLTLQAPADGRLFTLDLASRVAAAEIVSSAYFDRQGAFWIATTLGAFRMQLPDSGSHQLRWDEAPSGKPLVLAGPNIGGVIEDREGNVWFATSGGVDKLRGPALAKVDLPVGNPFPIAPAADGGVWIGALQSQLFSFPVGSRAKSVPAPPIRESEQWFSCFYQDPHGELWVGVPEALWHLSQGRWQSIVRPASLRTAVSVGEIQALAMDATGAMWASVVRAGVYRIVGNTWTPGGGYASLPQESPTVLTADTRGRVWFGYVNSKLARLENDRVTIFSVDDGLDLGTVHAITVRENNVWIGGEQGLARFDGRAFHLVKTAGGATFSTVSGIAEMPQGDLWMNTADGAVHIDAGEIRKLSANADHPVAHRLLDSLDGMPGSPVPLRPSPTIAVSKDGRVWFSTSNGVVWTDPKVTHSNTIVPTVHVKTVQANGTRHDTSTLRGPLRLPPMTRNIQISYTAPSLTIPERVRFKYRLEGDETAWQDVGTRREAFYTDLKPGSYRFRVIASNNDDLWNEAGASVELVIPPTFVQTRWFTALWVAAAAGLLFLLFGSWLRRAKAQLRGRLEERLVERERIARELHDTLLQGVQGLILKLQTVADHADMRGEARQEITDALDRADSLLSEGRDRVKNLRSASTAPTGLRQALLEAAGQMSAEHRAMLRVIENGTPRTLHPIVREETARIAIEAIFNALRHAEATTIEVELSYGRRQLRIDVRDDGRGMDESVLRSGRDGHFGFMGMHERTKRIHGQISIWSRPGAGTEVSLAVPASMAYVRKRWMWRKPDVVRTSSPY